MTVVWTQHGFPAALLALDATNTVVLRGDAARSFDRFDDAGRDSRASPRRRRASGREELGGRALVVVEYSDARRAGCWPSAKRPTGCFAARR